jgi:hypothetical protein
MNSVVGRIQNVSAVILVLIFFAEPLPAFASVKVVDVLLSGTSWTVPSDWYSYGNSIEVIGAVGGGNYGQSDCCGGGGGAYAKIFNLALSPGARVTYQVGSGELAAHPVAPTLVTAQTHGSIASAACAPGTMSVCAKAGRGAVSDAGRGGEVAGEAGTTTRSKAAQNTTAAMAELTAV